ncbi:MAG: recombinase family protein [Oscillospiraceae bacterium]
MSYIPFGFIKTPNGNIYVEPHQAAIVKQIYQRYLQGESLGGIADFLFKENIVSPTGQEEWTRPTISKLLSNSKYIGYIINFEDYFAVQVQKGNRSNIDEDRNKRTATRYCSQNVLSGLLVCAECGANYRRITKTSGEIVWRCANKVEHGKKICKDAPTVSDDTVKATICEMLNIENFNEEQVTAIIESILVQRDSDFKVEFKCKPMQIIEY